MSEAFKYGAQPWKALFITYSLLTILFVRAPVWTLLAIPRSLRPRSSWDIRRTVIVKILRQLLEIEEFTGLIHMSPDYRDIHSTRGVPGIWIPPVRSALVVGQLAHWAERAGVEPIRIPGYWIIQKGSNIEHTSRPQPGEKVVMALHGGSYTKHSSHPSDVPSNIARYLIKYVECVQRVFAPEYRLSSTHPYKEAHPFPTALLDALTGCAFLVNEMGFDPSDIIIEGDSAGGNLAYALTRYLVEYKGTPGLPAPPGALILLSPWADLSKSHDHIENGSALNNVTCDLLAVKKLDYAIRAFTGPHGLEGGKSNPYISPASLDKSLVVDFKGFPRTFIVAGGAEVLLDQIRTLRDRMIKDLGEGNGVSEGDGKVRYYEAADAFHDYLVFSWHEPEFTDTYKAIAEWISLA